MDISQGDVINARAGRGPLSGGPRKVRGGCGSLRSSVVNAPPGFGCLLSASLTVATGAPPSHLVFIGAFRLGGFPGDVATARPPPELPSTDAAPVIEQNGVHCVPAPCLAHSSARRSSRSQQAYRTRCSSSLSLSRSRGSSASTALGPRSPSHSPSPTPGAQSFRMYQDTTPCSSGARSAQPGCCSLHRSGWCQWGMPCSSHESHTDP